MPPTKIADRSGRAPRAHAADGAHDADGVHHGDGSPAARKTPKSIDRSPDRVHSIVTLLKLVTAPSRQMILLQLGAGEKNVGDICAALDTNSQPAVSHQLSLLRRGRLIEANRRGRNVYYELTESGRAVVQAFHVLSKSRLS